MTRSDHSGGDDLLARNISEVSQTVAGVNGLLHRDEGPFLYSLAWIGSKLGSIVEIGSWQGKSTIWLAKASQAVRGEKVYAIDLHPPWFNNEPVFRANLKMAGVENLVDALVQSSLDSLWRWEKPIGLLWIDGDHKYRSVRSDFFGWYPHVVNEGIVALHDTVREKGVRKFVVDHVDRLVRQGKLTVIGQVQEVLAVKKLKPLSPLQRVMRIVWLCLEFPRRNHFAARHASILGRNCLRDGNYRKARQFFRLAMSYQLLDWKNIRRLILTYLIGARDLYIRRKRRRSETTDRKCA